MKRLSIALTIAAAALLTACSTTHDANVVAPTLVGAEVETAPNAPMTAEAPLPEIDYCETSVEADQASCADDYVFLAATHFLGESDLEFDNGRILEVSVDEEETLNEAYASADFRDIMRRFDRAPEDGRLSHDEARDFENFMKLEQQLAAFDGIEEL